MIDKTAREARAIREARTLFAEALTDLGLEVEDILTSGAVPALSLRAAIIVGAPSLGGKPPNATRTARSGRAHV